MSVFKSGFMCGKIIREGSLPINRITDFDKILTKDSFADWFENIVGEDDSICSIISNSCVITTPDMDSPVFNISKNVTGATNEGVILTATVSELLKATPEGWTYVDDYTYSKPVSKNGIYTIEGEDLSGNVGRGSVSVQNIDKTSPANLSVTIPAFPNGGGTVTGSATATDNTSVNYKWSSTCNGIIFSDTSLQNPTITTSNNTYEDIKCTITVEACDEANNCVTKTKEVVIPKRVSPPTGVVSISTCIDTNKNGKYDTVTATLTTDQSINRPSGWAGGATGTSFRRDYATNGVKNVTITNSNGSKLISFKVTCIGQDSGSGLKLTLSKEGDLERAIVTALANGGDGNYTYVFSSSNSCIVDSNGNGTNLTEYSCGSGCYGNQNTTITVKAIDGNGNSVTKTIDVTLDGGDAPDTTPPDITEDWGVVSKSGTVTPNMSVSDNNEVTYTWSSDCATFNNKTILNPIIRFTQGSAETICDVTLVVRDSEGNTTTASHTYTIPPNCTLPAPNATVAGSVTITIGKPLFIPISDITGSPFITVTTPSEIAASVDNTGGATILVLSSDTIGLYTIELVLTNCHSVVTKTINVAVKNETVQPDQMYAFLNACCDCRHDTNEYFPVEFTNAGGEATPAPVVGGYANRTNGSILKNENIAFVPSILGSVEGCRYKLNESETENTTYSAYWTANESGVLSKHECDCGDSDFDL